MIPHVSIIVPVYNVEKYLVQCLETLLAQTLTDIEVIAVNDGSTDSSPEILENYAAKDNRLKIINKSNGGPSDARNVGLNAVRGEYIGFIDADDWIEKEMYEIMFNTANKNNTDIVVCNFIREFQNGTFGLHNMPITYGRIYNKIDIQKEIVSKMIGIPTYQEDYQSIIASFNSVCKNIYRRDLIIANKIWFVSEQFFAEDMLFNLQAYCLATSLIATDNFLYHYRYSSDSLVTKYRHNMLGMHLNLYWYIREFLNSHDMRNDYTTQLYGRICIDTVLLFNNIMKKNNPAGFIKKWHQTKEILNNPVIIDAFNNFSFHQFPFKNKVFFTLAKYRMALSVLVLYGWLIPFLRNQDEKRWE
jgi:glycosyltransferase involved in cell wall biosynthesis